MQETTKVTVSDIALVAAFVTATGYMTFTLNGCMGSLESRMDSLESRMDRTEARMDRIEAKIDSLDEKFDKLLIALADAGSFYRPSLTEWTQQRGNEESTKGHPSYQPSRAELREDLRMGSSPEDFERAAKALVRPVTVRYITSPKRRSP